MTDNEGLNRCLFNYFQNPNVDQNNLIKLMESIN